MKALLLSLLPVVALSACGPEAALWVVIEAPLRVPEQADAVRVVAKQRGESVYDEQLALNGAFPHTLSLIESKRSMVGGDVEITVTALKGTAQSTSWSRASAVAVLEAGVLTKVTVRLCDCP